MALSSLGSSVHSSSMFSSNALHRALIAVNAIPVGPANTPVTSVGNEPRVPAAAGSAVAVPRRPRKEQAYVASPLRPAVLARDRLLHWTTPFAISRSSSLLVIPRTDAQTLAWVMLSSLDPKTQENYGAGLLRFTQFCDTRGITEVERMPAPEVLLSAFAASWAGRISSSTVAGWLAG